MTIHRHVVLALCATALTVASAGCHHDPDLDILPLQKAGMDYGVIKEVKSLKPTDLEIAEVAKAKMGGISDQGAVALLQIGRSEHTPHFAEAAENLIQSGVSEQDVLIIGRLGQLKDGAGELQAMRLTGISDAAVIEVARRHAEGKTALSGVSLAKLKDAGVREATLCELIRRGVRDDQVRDIAFMKAHRLSDAEILRKYSTTT